MDQLTIVGLVAGLITTLGFVPQVVKGYRSGRMEDVSLTMPMVLMVGMGLWLVYGIFLGDLPIVLWNAVSIALNAAMVFLKLRSDARRRADPPVTR
ncbi:MAG TPA: SemiSWEET transporter [Methanomassiliicoccales archaeon]|nr:SemiSWEET transporter [Methanomassiliicoccales archaeon]